MSYGKEFQMALERSSRFNISPPELVSQAPARIMNDKRIRNMSRVLSPIFEGIVSYEDMVGQCMPLYLKARPILEEWLRCLVYSPLVGLMMKQTEVSSNLMMR